MAWRLARSLETLRAQLRAQYPKRSRVSDGTIGDTAHQKVKSDHNPINGVVTAFDITHDPVNGPPLAALIPNFLTDIRTKYIIFNKKIYNPSILSGKARAYNGLNAHSQHLHISVRSDPAIYDRHDDWNLTAEEKTKNLFSKAAPLAQPPSGQRQVLKRGMTGGDVPTLQLALRALGETLKVDGVYGPKTESLVKAIQARTGLKADGVVGPLTWAKLAVAPTSGQEQTMNVVKDAIKLYESLGWSHLQSVALVANLIWESGGHTTIKFDAHGDKDAGGLYRSHGAGQWNERSGRFKLLQEFAAARGTSYLDPQSQLLFLDHELKTTERKAGIALKAATTIEEAVTASILIWRPSIPHADKRLAIARKLV